MSSRTKKRRRITQKAKPVSAVSVAPSPWDQGAGGPANRHRLVEEDATEIDPETGKQKPNPNGVKRMRRETWVEIYWRRGKLTKQQAAIAAILHAAYAGNAARDPLAALGLNVDGVKCDDPNVNRMDAKRAFFAMWKRVPLRCRPVIEHVVLYDRPLRSMAGCGRGARELVHMQRLQEGLDTIS